MLSEKGSDLIVVNGFKFRKDRVTQRGVAWKCSVKMCRAILFLNETATLILFTNDIDSESLFPPEIWASNSVTSERTTNACEAFHIAIYW